MATNIPQRLCALLLVLFSFICGFYIGYIYASSFCDPIVNQSIQHFSPISLQSTIPNIAYHNTTNTSIIIQNNLFDEVYEWVFFKNRNTETSPYLVPKHKIIFCGIPKNALSLWKLLLLRLNNLEWWLTTQSKIHANDNGLGEYRLYDKEWNQVTEWMNNPNWYKAVFVRDPLERALSAVLDKGYVFKIRWSTFIQYLSNNSQDPLSIDQHFRPQHQFCDLYKYHTQYHIFVHNERMHKKQFFEDNGLWDEYGSNGWSKEEHMPQEKSSIKGNFLDFENVFRRHSVGSRKKVLRYYTIQHVSFLLKYYQYDYILFNMKIPHWICELIPQHYTEMSRYLSQQDVKLTPLQFRRTTSLAELRNTIEKYADLIELYSILKIFPHHLHPPCMTMITACVEYGRCAHNFNYTRFL